MGRDKKNPKPLDSAAFNTLVKTAAEVIRRHEQQTHAERHREVTVTASTGRVTVKLDITPDEDDPYAELSAFDVARRRAGARARRRGIQAQRSERVELDRERLSQARLMR